MKKVFLLVLALVMVFHLFTVYPVVAEGETADTMSLGQVVEEGDYLNTISWPGE